MILSQNEISQVLNEICKSDKCCRVSRVCLQKPDTPLKMTKHVSAELLWTGWTVCIDFHMCYVVLLIFRV